VLLPLRVRDWHETLHEDVRAAAIPKSLVGNLLPQEELDREWTGFPGFELGIKKDESQGTSSPVGYPATTIITRFSIPFTILAPNILSTPA
jgi:hypothetical protein